MPIIKIEDIENVDKETLKHFLNHENYDVYSIKESENMFSLVKKDINNPDSVK